MRISIAMCTYNGAAFLREQLESIANQTLQPDELIVSDDGSADGTLAVVREFARTATFPTRIVENQINLGYSRNFDQAVQLCSCEMIALADQDDIWYSTKLETLHERLVSDDSVGGIFSDGDLIDSNSQVLPRTLWESFRFSAKDVVELNEGGAVDVLLRRNVVTGMAFVFRSTMKPMLTSVPRTWIHDGWLALQIARRCRLIAEPARLVAYRVHGAQQVGAPASTAKKVEAIRGKGLTAYLDVVRARNLDEYQRTLVQYEDLISFLGNEDGQPDEQLIGKAAAKAAFARRGTMALSMPRLRRWWMLARHVDSYRDYSPTGLRGLVRDLLL